MKLIRLGTRYKFEPTMEGHQNSSYKSAEYGKRSSGDITAVYVCLTQLIVAHIVR